MFPKTTGSCLLLFKKRIVQIWEIIQPIGKKGIKLQVFKRFCKLKLFSVMCLRNYHVNKMLKGRSLKITNSWQNVT
jgi:hypothetical protein